MVASSQKPHERNLRFRGTEPVTLQGLFPDIATVNGVVFMVFTTPVAHADDEIQVQATGDG